MSAMRARTNPSRAKPSRAAAPSARRLRAASDRSGRAAPAGRPLKLGAAVLCVLAIDTPQSVLDLDINIKLASITNVPDGADRQSTEPKLDFELHRDDLSATRVLESDPPRPNAGEVAFAVERFGFSANNITYALLGERLRYWTLFPASAGWRRIPVWGYLRVIESRVAGIEEG